MDSRLRGNDAYNLPAAAVTLKVTAQRGLERGLIWRFSIRPVPTAGFRLNSYKFPLLRDAGRVKLSTISLTRQLAMLEISEKDILRSLQQDNPWWQTGEPPAKFAHVRAYFPRFQELASNWDIRRSVILMGPRRVGKTVMLRQLIAKLISSGFPAKCILFAPIDTPTYSGMPLDRFIKIFEEHTGHGNNAKRMVIFDEIQYLKDWEIHLKVLTDRHPNTRFVASGSAAAALRLKSQESGAGRFTDFLLPPLTFAEFLDLSAWRKA
jgi:hypothetical protein